MLGLFRQKPGPLLSLLDFLYPSLCSGCGEYDEKGDGLCSLCKESILAFPNPICLNCEQLIENAATCGDCGEDKFPLFSHGVYADSLRNAIVSFKYQGVLSFCPWLAGMVAEKFAEQISSLEADKLIPIPLHPSREYSRGFNQATRFACELASRLDLPVDETTFIRIKRGQPQAKMKGATARRANIAGAFSVTDSSESLARVILVDDVVTTGLTIAEARKTLSQAGFLVVAAISMAYRSSLLDSQTGSEKVRK